MQGARGLSVLFFLMGYFSKYNNPLSEISEWWLGGNHWSEFLTSFPRNLSKKRDRNNENMIATGQGMIRD